MKEKLAVGAYPTTF